MTSLMDVRIFSWFVPHSEFLNKFNSCKSGLRKNKSRISHHAALDFIDFCKNELNLNIIGLMCLPPLNSDPREYFNKLKEIAISKKIEHLSMGMSQDYKIAINCGSTYVRIGSAIFN